MKPHARIARGAKLLFAPAGFAWFLLTTAPTHAQSTPCTPDTIEQCVTDEQADRLAALLSNARTAAAEQRWTDALRYLEQAEAIVSLGVTRVAMARAYRELGESGQAAAIAREVLTNPDPDARRLAEELLADMEAERAASEAASDAASEPAQALPDPVGVTPPVTVSGAADNPPLLPRRSPVLPAVLSGLCVSTLAPGVAWGLESQRLERDANNYDRTAPDASAAELARIERNASSAASRANVMYVVSAALGGAAVGVLVDRVTDTRRRRARAQ